jgi:hypothetical protein
MNDRKATWLYYLGVTLPAVLVIVFWVVPKVALQRFRRRSEGAGVGPVDVDEGLGAKTA